MAKVACGYKEGKTMTLFRQIALLLSLFLLLLAGIFMTGDFSRTEKLLQGQMQTTARDMATTLGIVISNLPEGGDEATLEVLFNSIFDSGYYSAIELVAVDGSVIHQKSQPIKIIGVPDWFIKRVSLSAAEGTSQVMQGWSQLGQLRLNLHPGYAYSGLYNAFISTLQWFALVFIVVNIVLWLLLHYLLLPLQRVKEQADSIHKNQFVQQHKLPATKELKRVVEAMNRMVSKVQSVFDDQQKTLARYQRLLYQDKLTGLGNRRYLLDQLQQSLAEESSFHGCLGVIKLVNFEQFREHHGYQLSDELLKHMAEQILQPHAGLTTDKAARLSDDEFAFLIAADEDSVADFIQQFYQEFKSFAQVEEMHNDFYLVAGLAALESGENLGDLLSSVDYCLTQAVSEGPYCINRKESTTLLLPQGKMQWRHWLEALLKNERLFLVGQLAMDSSKLAVQKELFIRCRNENNQVIPASAFMPMASNLGLATEIDKAVFKLIIEDTIVNRETPLAINLSPSFFELADAHAEFEHMLNNCRDRGIALCIEASHHVLQHHPDMCSKVSEKVEQFGHQFGMDNLDLGQSLQLLQSARFDYVKINATTLENLKSDELSAGYQALKTITNTLDIRIIVVGVDSQSLFDQFLALGIEVMQGNLLGEPEPL